MYLVEKGKKNLETVRMIRDREQLLHGECMNRLGVFILKKLHRGTDWAGLDSMSRYKN